VIRKSALDRREDIVAATVQVLLEKGVLAATTRDVTSRLGVGAGLLNHYFAWTELRALAFARVAAADLVGSLTSRETTPAALLMEELVASCYLAEQDPVWRVWMEATDLAVEDMALGKQVWACGMEWRRALADLLRRGNAESAWNCDDPAGAAWRILAMITGIVSLTLAPNAPLSRAEATQHLRKAVEHETPRKTQCRKPSND